MRKLFWILIFCWLYPFNFAHAGDVTVPTTWQNGDSVTATKLNAINNAFANVINGGLDNDNANTLGGYRFYEKKSSLPSAGDQGRVIFSTADNTLNFDNGSAWQTSIAPSGTLSTGKVPIYDSGWKMVDLSPYTSSGLPFNITTGHNHDGVTSRKVLATNLDFTGGSSTTFLRGDGSWAAISSDYTVGTEQEGVAATNRAVTATSYTKYKSLTPLARGGNVTVTYSTSGYDQNHSRVYINDIARGTEHINVGAGRDTQSENFAVNAGDVISVYAYKTAPGTLDIQDLKVLVTNPTNPVELSGY